MGKDALRGESREPLKFLDEMCLIIVSAFKCDVTPTPFQFAIINSFLESNDSCKFFGTYSDHSFEPSDKLASTDIKVIGKLAYLNVTSGMIHPEYRFHDQIILPALIKQID